MFNPQPKPEKRKKKTRHYIKPGRKTDEWEAAKKILKPAFEEANITYCEVGVLLCELEEFYDLMQVHRHNFFMNAT